MRGVVCTVGRPRLLCGVHASIMMVPSLPCHGCGNLPTRTRIIDALPRPACGACVDVSFEYHRHVYDRRRDYNLKQNYYSNTASSITVVTLLVVTAPAVVCRWAARTTQSVKSLYQRTGRHRRLA
jgi:hypothetical protein